MNIGVAQAQLPFVKRGFFTPSIARFKTGEALVSVLPDMRGYPPLQALSLQVFRDGAATPQQKFVTLFKGDDPLGMYAVAFFQLGAQAKTQWISASLLRGQFLVQASDNGSPRLGLLRWPVLDASTTSLSYNLTEGAGGGLITQPAKISSRTQVDGVGRVRKVVVVERQADGEWRVAGAGDTSADSWSDIELGVTASGTHYALALDDFGVAFEPGKALQVGQRVRPTRFEGWLYEVTEPGNLPAVEPQWWPVQGDNPSRQIGTVRAVAVRYYVPLALGPVPVEMT